MAPRVHDSGHWTIEGAEISQFENHVRAIGSLPPARTLLGLSGVHWHDYDKSSRPGRKLGHLIQFSATRRERDRVAAKLRRLAIR